MKARLQPNFEAQPGLRVTDSQDITLRLQGSDMSLSYKKMFNQIQ
jgi:hypothetical protein